MILDTKSSEAEKFEAQIQIQTKKHIFVHSVEEQIRLKKLSKKAMKGNRDRVSITSDEKRREILFKKYMINQKSQSVCISFGQLFDSQSRYKVAVKKPQFAPSNFGSNVSFNQKNVSNLKDSQSQCTFTPRTFSDPNSSTSD